MMVLRQATTARFRNQLKLITREGTISCSELLAIICGIAGTSCDGSSTAQRQAVACTSNLNLGRTIAHVGELEVRAASLAFLYFKLFAFLIHAPERNTKTKM
jgi:hypothetical protein